MNEEYEKNKRGWWFSIFFMLLVMGLIVFLARVSIVDENRDVLVGILGMITGSISSMIAIASGRDPSEVEDLKDKLAAQESDRAALIARLRDANIQMQLLREQQAALQFAIIERLSVLNGFEHPANDDEVKLPEVVDQWLPAQPKPED
jgi:uncharacterized transporter YbjL